MTTVIESEIRANTAGNHEIQAAAREHQEAVDLLAALEERVRAGDPDVRPAELRDAREMVEFAALRIEAAKRRAAQLATEARHALYVEIGAEARALDLSDDQVIGDAFRTAVDAMRHLYEVAARRSEAVRALHERAAAAVAEADRHGERQLLQAAGIHTAGLYAGRPDTVIHHVDGTVNRVDDVPAYTIAEAVMGRMILDEENRLSAAAEAAGRRFYTPFSGEVRNEPTRALTRAAREFPALDDTAPAAPTGDATAA